MPVRKLGNDAIYFRVDSGVPPQVLLLYFCKPVVSIGIPLLVLGCEPVGFNFYPRLGKIVEVAMLNVDSTSS